MMMMMMILPGVEDLRQHHLVPEMGPHQLDHWGGDSPHGRGQVCQPRHPGQAGGQGAAGLQYGRERQVC